MKSHSEMIAIVGAGLSGLIAANMLQRHRITILEKQSTVPNNHHSVLHFRSSVVGDTVGIPFRKVTMHKAVAPWKNPIADALAYSFKNTGQYRSDRSIIRGNESGDRFIAPTNFINQLVDQLGDVFVFDANWVPSFGGPIISTIPMPQLMKLLNYPRLDKFRFHYTTGTALHGRIEHCDAYVTLIVPEPNCSISRISITGDAFIAEGAYQPDLLDQGKKIVAELLGLRDWTDIRDLSIHNQLYAKILPVDDDERKRFLAWATDQHNIYSLGRYATWRPGLLLDDLIKDVRLIENWITKDDRYDLQHRRG